MSRGREKGSRARKAAIEEPEKPQEPEIDVLSDEQPGHPEKKKYPIVLPVPVTYSLRSQGPQPKLLVVNMGKKTLTSMITQYLRPRPMRYLQIHSLAKMIHQRPYRSPRSHQSHHKLTHHRQATKKNKRSAGPNRERRDYKKKAMKNDTQIEKDIIEFYKTNPCPWDLRQEDHHNKDTKKKLLEEITKTTGVS